MEVHEERPEANYIINAYELGDWIAVNSKRYTNTLVVSPSLLIHQGLPDSISTMTEQHWQQLLNALPEILLIGTGKQAQQLSAHELKRFHQQKIGVECMDTGAACRTYSALLAEGRSVMALLFNPSKTKE